MRYAGVQTDLGVLDLYKVAYLYTAVQMSIRTQMYKRSCLSAAVYLALVRLYVVQDNIILYNAVGYIAVRTYLTAVADNRFSLDYRIRKYNRIVTDLYILTDYDSVRQRNIHTLIHKLSELSLSCDFIQSGKLTAAVCTEYNVSAVCRVYALLFRNGNSIGKIIFAGGIVVAELI